MATMTFFESPELLVAPGEARAFAFGLPPNPFFAQAFPSRPQGSKQSLWTVAHGIATQGVLGGEFPHHQQIVHWVTVQVADPQVPTPFTIQAFVLNP
jgi:hypothetical protein